jgi:hypothetical protein
MQIDMAERVRLVVLVDEEIRAALRLAAAKRNTEMSVLVEDILREVLGDEIEEMRRLQAQPKPTKKRKPHEGGA